MFVIISLNKLEDNFLKEDTYIWQKVELNSRSLNIGDFTESLQSTEVKGRMY